MSFTSFSVGRDTQLVVIGPTGRVDLTHVTGFESRQMTHSVRISRLDGSHIGTELPRGWEGNFEIERGTSEVDDFIAAAEQDYFAGRSVAAGTMYQYVTETDGSTTTYQYDGVVYRLASAGVWRGDSSVKQKLEFYAAKRRRV
jgi:hypothetical protein